VVDRFVCTGSGYPEGIRSPPVTAERPDDPCRLLDRTNAALRERDSASIDYVTAACFTWLEFHVGQA
jgi:hypothetical protein